MMPHYWNTKDIALEAADLLKSAVADYPWEQTELTSWLTGIWVVDWLTGIWVEEHSYSGRTDYCVIARVLDYNDYIDAYSPKLSKLKRLYIKEVPVDVATANKDW